MFVVIPQAGDRCIAILDGVCGHGRGHGTGTHARLDAPAVQGVHLARAVADHHDAVVDEAPQGPPHRDRTGAGIEDLVVTLSLHQPVETVLVVPVLDRLAKFLAPLLRSPEPDVHHVGALGEVPDVAARGQVLGEVDRDVIRGLYRLVLQADDLPVAENRVLGRDLGLDPVAPERAPDLGIETRRVDDDLGRDVLGGPRPVRARTPVTQPFSCTAPFTMTLSRNSTPSAMASSSRRWPNAWRLSR